MPKTRIEALKVFFGTPEKPVTNIELIDLRRGDKAGFEELAEAAFKALGWDKEGADG